MLLNLLLKPLPEDKGPVDHLHNRLLSQNMLRHQGAQVTAAMERSLQHTAEGVGVVTRDQLQTWQQDVSVVRLDARVSAPAVHVGCPNLIRSSVRQDDFDALPQHVVEVLVEFWRGSSVGSGRLMELRAEVTQHLSCPLSLGKLSGNRQQSRQVVNVYYKGMAATTLGLKNMLIIESGGYFCNGFATPACQTKNPVPDLELVLAIVKQSQAIQSSHNTDTDRNGNY